MSAERAGVVVVGTLRPTVGGITTVIEGHLAGLARAGVKVVTVNTGSVLRARPNRVSPENVAAAVSDAGRVWRAVRRHRPALVAVHSAALPLLPELRSLTLVTAARLAGARVAVHLHGDVRSAVATEGRSYRAALGAIARVADALVAVTSEDAGALRALLPNARVEVVENCVDCERFRPGPAEEAPAEVRAVFVGAVGRRKGVGDLIDALRLVDGLPCDIVGGAGPEGADVEAALREAGADLVAAGRLVFHGHLEPDGTLAVLRRAAIFVLPSHSEALSVALLEAMACGLPAVVTDVGAVGERVVRAGCGIVIRPGDVDGLAAALRRLAGDPAARATMGAAARQAVEARHCCDAVWRDLAALYRSLER